MSNSNSKLVDIELGGESRPYESIRLFTEDPKKQTGQMGVKAEHTKSEMKTRDFGGETTASTEGDAELARKLGNAGQPTSSWGEKDKADAQNVGEKTRGQQQYGPGSGVGA